MTPPGEGSALDTRVQAFILSGYHGQPTLGTVTIHVFNRKQRWRRALAGLGKWGGMALLGCSFPWRISCSCRRSYCTAPGSFSSACRRWSLRPAPEARALTAAGSSRSNSAPAGGCRSPSPAATVTAVCGSHCPPPRHQTLRIRNAVGSPSPKSHPVTDRPDTHAEVNSSMRTCSRLPGEHPLTVPW